MKTLTLAFLLVFSYSLSFAQSQNIDSLMLALKNAPNGTVRYQMCSEIFWFYEELDRDSALYYAEIGMKLVEVKGQKLALSSSLSLSPGIPDSVKDKIFQPFLSTKPTGKGTGLGLSLAYDVVKAHGGEIKVKTEINEGSEFIIQLPVV